MPPSKDDDRPRPDQSLRKPSGKRPGGQPGRKGTTLEMTATPDTTIELYPNHCRSCGGHLSEIAPKLDSVRQIVDIPPIKATYTEYRAHSKQCSCGCATVADLPKGVDAPVSYGANTEALIAYLHARQYLPFARMRELLADVLPAYKRRRCPLPFESFCREIDLYLSDHKGTCESF